MYADKEKVKLASNTNQHANTSKQSVQTKNNPFIDATAQRKANPFLKEQASEASENKTGLPDTLKTGIESLSGMDMGDVKVHYNSDKPAQLQALAYAQGTDIHVANGQEKHLPHEAWHVVQQKQGRVQPTAQLKDTQINDNTALEQEADKMGDKALSATPQNASLDSSTKTAQTPAQLIAQRKKAPAAELESAVAQADSLSEVYGILRGIYKVETKSRKLDDIKAALIAADKIDAEDVKEIEKLFKNKPPAASTGSESASFGMASA